MSAPNVADQVIAVTGAGKGLGREYALWLAAHGAKVVVNNRIHPDRPSSAARVVDEIRAAGGTAHVDEHSVEDPEGGAAIIANAVEAFGRIDGLVCNAGVIDFAPADDLDPVRFRQLMDINFWGTVYPTMAAMRTMSEQGSGRIVLTVSLAGLFGQPESAYYGASRSAIVGFARSSALDLADKGDIRVNMISPQGYTEMAASLHPTKLADADFMSPRHVAPVVGWLASPDCDVSGVILHAGCARVRRLQVLGGKAIDIPEGDDVQACWPALNDMTDAVEASAAYEAGNVLRAGLG